MVSARLRLAFGPQRLRRNLLWPEQLLAGVEGGYYWRDVKTGREEFSGRLRQMLGLKEPEFRQ